MASKEDASREFIEGVAERLNNPEFFGRTLLSEVVRAAARCAPGDQDVTFTAEITVRSGTRTASARSDNCLPITFCFEDPSTMQSVCINAYVC